MLVETSNKIIFVDTETIGVPKTLSTSYKNIDNWPTIKQIAWIVYDKDGSIDSSYNFSITKLEKVSNGDSVDYEPLVISPIFNVLDTFLYSLSLCDVIIGHNIEYDVNVILCELYRYGKDVDKLVSMQQFCTMKNSVCLCGFDTNNGDRYPKLQELYSKLFHKPFENAHDAYCDIKATADCYWEMFNKQYLNIEAYPFLISHNVRTRMINEDVEKADYLTEQIISKDKQITIIEEEANLTWSDPTRKECVLHSIELNQKRDELRASGTQLFKEALSLYEHAASLGDGYSMIRCGWIYYSMLSNLEKALEWLNKAISIGYHVHDCLFECGFISVLMHNYSDAYSYYGKFIRICAETLDTISRRDLKLYIAAYEKGFYGEWQNYSKAIEICETVLAKQRVDVRREDDEDGLRCKYADLLYLSGEKIAAIEQYTIYLDEFNEKQKQRSKSYTRIETLLIKSYFEGEGVGVDYNKAKIHIDNLLHYHEDNCTAMYYLGHFYYKGLMNKPINYEKAYYCYEKALKQYPDAMRMLGIMCLYGKGCNKDKKSALKYLKQAKDNGINVSPFLRKARIGF